MSCKRFDQNTKKPVHQRLLSASWSLQSQAQTLYNCSACSLPVEIEEAVAVLLPKNGKFNTTTQVLCEKIKFYNAISLKLILNPHPSLSPSYDSCTRFKEAYTLLPRIG
jgi:hypothetical protein